MKKAAGIFILLLALTSAPAAADEASFERPQQQARYQKLLSELRCLVCQNQTLADSPAPLAGDMRRAVAEMIRRGEDDAAVIAFMTARYGDFVHYRPPFRAATVLLWWGPFLIALLGMAVLLKKRKAAALSLREQRQVDQLLEE